MMSEIIEARIVELAQRLIRIPSHNPPGDEDRIAQFVSDWLRGAGLDPRLVPLEPGRSSIVARVAGRERGCIVLCGHLDTVGTDPEAWRVPPLEGRIVDGRLFGLGAADMKGSVAVLMHVAAWLVEQSAVPPQDVVLALTADEEFGYRGAATIAESGLIDDAELLVVAEPSAGHVYTGQKGELWIDASVTGREAHGSTPDLGINTILPAARFCNRVQEEIATFPEVLGLGRTTLNIGQFHGGRRVNIVPDRSHVELDVRTVRPKDHDVALELIDRIGAGEAKASGSQFKRSAISYHPPIVGHPIGPHVTRMLRAVAEITGHEPVTGISPFSTDAVSIVPRLDVPVLIYGPGDIAQAHRPDESIDPQELRVAYEVLRRFVAAE
jgi:succinyl-diaminopimelate desuccinylase